jgi:hypothetical protein
MERDPYFETTQEWEEPAWEPCVYCESPIACQQCGCWRDADHEVTSASFDIGERS